MWIRLLLLIAVVVAVAWIAHALGEEEPDYQMLYVICKPKSHVNAREFPKKGARTAGRLECGDEVLTLGERRGRYLKIYGPSFESADVWIHAGYLVEDKPEIYEKGVEGTIIGKGRVALRRYVRGQRRAWIRPGKKVKVYVVTDEWVLTNHGYIKREFVEIKQEEPANEGAYRLRRKPGSLYGFSCQRA